MAPIAPGSTRRIRVLPLTAAVLLAMAALAGPGGSTAAGGPAPATAAGSEAGPGAGGGSGAASGAAVTPAGSGTFSNPVVTKDGPDPWIVQHEGTYYHLGTTGTNEIRMRKAGTLGGLRDAEPVTVWKGDAPSRCCNHWAYELHRLPSPEGGERWYLTYSAGEEGTLDEQNVHVLESAGDDPMGPFHYKGQVDPYGDDRWMIDGTYLTMPDGRLYMLYSEWEGPSQNLKIAPLANPWTASGTGVTIARPTHAWEKDQNAVNEGPEILRHGDRTFMTFSASFCASPNYALGLMELNGADPMEPAAWKKHPRPVFERNDKAGVYGPGHNGFFQSPDGKEVWMTYHANDTPGAGCGDARTSRAQKIRWNENGTPDLGRPVANGVELPEPSGE